MTLERRRTVTAVQPRVNEEAETEPGPQKTAFLFPGQGLQPSEMVSFFNALRDADPELVADRIRKTNVAHAEATGTGKVDIERILQDPDSGGFNSTAIVQPVVFMLSELALEHRKSTLDRRIPASFIAGHSLGQLAAGVAAGIFSYEDGIRVAAHRGVFMQEATEAAPSNHISIFGLSEEVVGELCQETEGEIALINAPELIVVGTAAENVDDVITLAKERGAKIAAPLPTAGAFHTRFMQSAAIRLEDHLSSYAFQSPRVPIIANSTGEPITTGIEFSFELTASMTRPVQWARSINTMKEAGVERFVEVGPGNSLSKLNTRNGIARNQTTSVLGR